MNNYILQLKQSKFDNIISYKHNESEDKLLNELNEFSECYEKPKITIDEYNNYTNKFEKLIETIKYSELIKKYTNANDETININYLLKIEKYTFDTEYYALIKNKYEILAKYKNKFIDNDNDNGNDNENEEFILN